MPFKPWGILFTVDFFLSLFLFIFNLTLFGCPLFFPFFKPFFPYPSPIMHLPLFHTTFYSVFQTSFFFTSMACPWISIFVPFFLPHHQTYTHVMYPSLTSNFRHSQFQMSWLQSCWVTRQTLVQWWLWSLGGASFTDPSACVYPCLHPGGIAPETLGRVTPPVYVCFALS